MCVFLCVFFFVCVCVVFFWVGERGGCILDTVILD